MLSVNELGCTRGDFRLHIDSWHVAEGEMHAVLGANGAGKSTLLRILAGELPYRGHLEFHGRALCDWPLAERARHIGVLPQHSQLSFDFTAREVVALGLTPLTISRRDAQRRLQRMLERTGCAALADRAWSALSGGERQRVSLARVLLQLSQAQTPPLLLLDEPTSAQDLGHQHGLLSLARELAREESYAVVAILHDLNLALRYADKCLLLAEGERLSGGAPAALLDPQRVEELWGYRPQRVMVGDLPQLV